jgi:hypothetical protein
VSSSSYDLSPFSMKVGCPPGEGAGGLPWGSLSASIGDLWPEINQLDEVGTASTSMVTTQEPRGSGV